MNKPKYWIGDIIVFENENNIIQQMKIQCAESVNGEWTYRSATEYGDKTLLLKAMESNILYKKGQKEPSIKGIKNCSSKDFDVFWLLYPRKEGKAEAKKLLLSRPHTDLPAILEGLRNYKASEQWIDPTFIPHAQTWLRQKRWEDDINQIKQDAPSIKNIEL